jgi:7,8-dihydropterin-6-yl-methyl-4-(beta-D-ribofuranosyl)aminobenzene 5'-phosphate synthase
MMDQVVKPTIAALKAFKPTYVIPTHCTGRLAVQMIEKEMPDQFILNMSGTRLTFSA